MNTETKPFEIIGVDKDSQTLTIRIRRDLAETVARHVASRYPQSLVGLGVTYAFAQSIFTAINVLVGRKKPEHLEFTSNSMRNR